MQPDATRSIVGQSPTTITQDQPVVYGALVSVILALATAITVLWRRSERRYLRELAAAQAATAAATTAGEAARDREVKRTDDLAKLLMSERAEFQKALEAQRVSFGSMMDSALEKFGVQMEHQRADHTNLIRDLFDRKAAEDRTRDAKAEELIKGLSAVIDSANRRIARRT